MTLSASSGSGEKGPGGVGPSSRPPEGPAGKSPALREAGVGVGWGADAAAAMLDWRDARSQRSPSANPGGSASSPRSLGPVLGTRGDVLLPGEGV